MYLFHKVILFYNISLIEPKFDPYETSFEIDQVKNYEYFYPIYNLDNVINRIF